MAWSKANIRLFIGIMVTLGFFGIIGALVLIAVPQVNADIVKVLVGFIGGAFVTMISFYFGDSEGK